MNIAETEVHPDSLENFRATRDKQYKTFIYQEAMVGENICVETLFKITDREIAAGRMPHNHSCRNLALEAVAAPHLTRQQLIKTKRGESENLHTPDKIKTSSLLDRIRSWIFKR